MRLLIGSVVCAVALIGFAAASPIAAAPQATAAASDKALDDRIERAIHNDAVLKKYNIGVSVENGVATLTGTVHTEADRAKATRRATMKGISRVDNKITVELPNATTTGTTGSVKEKTKEGAEKTKDKAAKVGEKTKEGAEKVADKTKEGLSKTGEVITDAWITTRVKSKFVGEDVMKGSDINVDTNNHVVTLKGTVPSAAARARAVEQAKEVEGVHRVVDQLTIGPKK